MFSRTIQINMQAFNPRTVRSFAIRFSILLLLVASPAAQPKLIMVDDARGLPDTVSTRLDIPASTEAPVWIADKGSTLHASLQKWVEQAQWTLVWDVPDGRNQQLNYSILAPLTFKGSIEQAVAACIALYKRAEKPLAVRIQRTQKLFYVHLKVG